VRLLEIPSYVWEQDDAAFEVMDAPPR